MGFDEGQIIFNSENGAYYPGQVVLGKLVFDQQKRKTFRGIYVEIKGYCKNHWTSTRSRRVGDRDESYTVCHDAYEEYFNRKIYVIGGESGEYHIDPGHYEFQFECPLPETCPSTFDHDNGRITYQVKAVVDRAFKLDQKKKAVFRVIAPYDLNMVPAARSAIEMQFENSFCCWCMGAGTAEVIVKIPASGFCPGQRIPIELACRNDSTVELDTIRFTLKRYLRFRTTDEPDSREITDEVAELKKGPVPRRTERSWALEMDVPPMDVFNLEHCHFIDVDFQFKVSVETSGCHVDDDETHRFFIGSIPLRGSQENTDPNSQQPAENPQFHFNNSYPPPPIINQPLPSYPTNSPYPGGSPYLHPKQDGGHLNSAYPNGNPQSYSPQGSPYPNQATNAPYPGRISPVPPPYPLNQGSSPYAPIQGTPPYPPNQGTSPFPPNQGSSPYPPNQGSSPYPPNQGSSPYPLNQGSSPYPPNQGSSPYPPNQGNTPYPSSGRSSPTPYPAVSPYGAGLKTGSLGFTVPGLETAIPLLPPTVPYPPTASSPFAASAPPE